MMFRPASLSALLLGIAVCAQSRGQDDATIPYGEVQLPPTTITYAVHPRTIQLIDEAIAAETDLPRKTLLVRDLGLCPVPESAAILKRLLADPEPLVRAEAIRSLARINAADDATLQPLAADASVIVQRELAGAKFAPAIVAGAGSNDPTLRAAALSVSVNEQTDRAILGTLDKLDPPMQAIALRTLGGRKFAPASSEITKLLATQNVVTRVAAIESLAQLSAITRPQIDQQLQHPHSAVRVAATRSASTLGDPDRIAIARAAMADKDLAVRTEAVRLDVSSDASFVEAYFAQLPLGYEPLRLASREALVRIAQANAQAKPEVARGAAERLSNTDAPRRVDGSYILGQLRSTEGLADHIKLLADADWTVVEQASRSLGPIGDPSAGPELVATALRTTDDKFPSDRTQLEARAAAGEQAVLSTVMLKYTPVVAATKRFYLDKRAPAGVRNASIYAAGMLGEPEEVGKSVRPLLGRIPDPEESPQAIAEAIKALGNARVKSAASAIEKIRKDESSPDYQYVSTLALDRINGTRTPFERQPDVRTPDTTLRALDPTE